MSDGMTFYLWTEPNGTTAEIRVPIPKKMHRRLMLRLAHFLWMKVAAAEYR